MSIYATDFDGVDRTGAANSTTGLKKFFDHCIANRVDGFVGAGTYLVTPGILAFDNGCVQTPWPNIHTAGYLATKLKVDPATTNISPNNAPLIKISNGTYPGTSAGYWDGGYLGGFHLLDQTGHTSASSRHGLELRGVQGTTFGHLRGDGLSGSTIHLDNKVGEHNNPDPYHVAACLFEGVELYNGAGRVFTNANGQGWNGCRIRILRGVATQLGGLKGFGAGNSIEFISMGACAGWALDADTTDWSSLFGFIIDEAELDDVQYGIRLQRYRGFKFRGRVIHRFDATALNTDNKYWPRKVIDLGSGLLGGVTDFDALIDHRIDEGGALADLGTFIDFNGVGVANFAASFNIIPYTGLTVPDSDLFDNFNTAGSGDVRLVRDGKTILRNAKRRAARSYANGSTTISNTNSGTAGEILAFAVEDYDESDDYSTSAHGFTIPWTGKLRFKGQFFAAVPAAGAFVRYYLLLKRGGAYSTVLYGRLYHQTTNAELHQLDGEVAAVAGDIVYFAADTNAASALSVTAIISHQSDNFAVYEMVE